MSINNKSHKITGSLFLLYFAISMACYFILAAVFQFPDILRVDGTIRFNLFQANQSIIVPTYYFWALTGFLQILMSTMLYSLIERKDALSLTAMVMGILSGVFQLIGFIRWVVFIPLLSSAYQTGEISAELTFFFEKIANGYLGMSLGEHMGNLFLAFWIFLASLSLYRSTVVHKSLARMGGIIGLLFMVFSFESLGAIFSPLTIITVPLWGVVYIWLIFLAISFFRYKKGKEAKPFHWGIWLGGFIFWLCNVIPAFL